MLTGLSNRRGFELFGTKVLQICVRRSLSATLLVLDLDGLKRINDTLGHHAGDTALREFAAALLTAFRGSDVIARLGGDEFAVLLVGAPMGPPAIDRLRSLLAERNTAADTAFQLETSLGSAAFDPRAPQSLEALSMRADAAMYAEKQQRAAKGVPTG